MKFVDLFMTASDWDANHRFSLVLVYENENDTNPSVYCNIKFWDFSDEVQQARVLFFSQEGNRLALVKH